MKNIKFILFSALLFMGNLTISADDIIEHRGDRYVIHVEALNPDSEMTLLDVLHLCPELISYDGKNITNGYRLRIDNTNLHVDLEAALENIKASELRYVQICNYTSAAKGVNGGGGVIDIYYKPQEGTSGKVAIEGSTYGNGKLYADIMSKVSPNLTLTGYAMTNQQYTKGYPTDGGTFKSRSTSEAAHLFIDWNISKNDELKIKLYQQFTDYKEKVSEIANNYTDPTISRYGNMAIIYERTVNENGALWIVEGGADYSSTSSEFPVFGSNTNATRETAPYFYSEIDYPVLNNDLWIMFGWEIDYDNIWYRGVSREQIMLNNIYLQLDYSHGPWVITLGDRFRHMNYWNRLAIPNDNDLWAHNRNNHGFVSTVGYKTNGHFIQAAFNRDHYLPFVEDFFGDGEIVNGKRTYNTAYKTNLVWRAEARYTYQNKNFVFFGNVHHTWMNDMPFPNEQTTAVRLSATWNKGPLRLTAGVNYYHHHINATPVEGGKYENFYNLKLAPTLLLGKGFRVSSVLLYSSRQKLYDIHPHLYSSVKVNKDFGRHINVFADFHDLAGMPTMRAEEMSGTYNKRALTVGMTYRFGGKK